ncbi:MAG: AAA family ATPase [Thermoguttaceae bacterium]|jgi:hypothetical protein
MFLSRFGVKNYKCLGEIDIPLTPIHVLIGQNDAGKTSLLEAMDALCSYARRPNDVFPRPWSGRELVFHRAAEPTLEFWGEWSEMDGNASGAQPSSPSVRTRLVFKLPAEGTNCRLAAEGVAIPEDSREASETKRLPGATVKDGWVGVDTAPGHPFQGGEALGRAHLRLFKSQLSRPAHMYALNARAMRAPAALDYRRRFRMGPDGFGLPTLLDDILGHDGRRFGELTEEFCHYFQQFRHLRIVQSEVAGSGGTVQTGKGIVLETKSGNDVRAQQASDGAILFLGLLALSYLPEPPALLLIEEPENGVYPIRLAKVIELLKSLICRAERPAFPQIILSTHSPYVLSLFAPEEVTFLSRPPGDPDGPVRARPLRDAPNIRERLAGGEFYLGELWYNLTEEELFGDA